MNKFILKVKKATKDFFTKKGAFSLVELIVVIAIMAVMAAVLAPALLGYVERSRAKKDVSAMGEVTNAIQLSLADQNVYDELLQYSEKDNYSCYCDGDTATNTDANKITTKEPDLWLFNDNARLLDETVYKPAGKMRGATVTFKPNGKAEYILKDGIVNKIGDDTTKKGTNGGAILENCPELYNRLRSTVGDTIKVSSQTYRNSDYTIFVSMGTTGGNQADKQDAIKVYGQYNGTNLPEVATPVAGAGQGAPAGGSGGSGQPGGGGAPTPDPVVELKRNGIIPDGATYTPNGGTAIVGNGTNTFPEAPQAGDTYEEGDYIYKYNEYFYCSSWWSSSSQNGWGVRVKDNSKTSYGEILSEIAGQPVTNVRGTFEKCKELIEAPSFPSNVSRVYSNTFEECSKLETVVLPNSITSFDMFAFDGLMNLTNVTLSNNIIVIYQSAFQDCYKLDNIVIPSGVSRIENDAFRNCKSLKNITIPEGVTSIAWRSAFYGCSSLTDIYYTGTQERWNSIEKGTNWKKYISAKVIHCTDGNICLQHTGGTATCSRKAICEYCGQEYGELGNHEYDSNTHICKFCNGNALNQFNGPVLTNVGVRTVSVSEVDYDYNTHNYYGSCSRIITFCPTVDGNYIFKASCDDGGTYGVLYDMNMNCLIEDDDNNGNGDFKMSYNCKAGKVYYLAAGMESYWDPGTITITISK